MKSLSLLITLSRWPRGPKLGFLPSMSRVDLSLAVVKLTMQLTLLLPLLIARLVLLSKSVSAKIK